MWGQNHQCAFVQNYIQLKIQFTEHFLDDVPIRLLCRDEHSSNGKRADTTFTQATHKGFRWSSGQHFYTLCRRVIQHPAILSHNAIKDFWASENAEKLAKFTSGHQYQAATGRLKLLESIARSRLNGAIAGDCSVVISGEAEKFHWSYSLSSHFSKATSAAPRAIASPPRLACLILSTSPTSGARY